MDKQGECIVYDVAHHGREALGLGGLATVYMAYVNTDKHGCGTTDQLPFHACPRLWIKRRKNLVDLKDIISRSVYLTFRIRQDRLQII